MTPIYIGLRLALRAAMVKRGKDANALDPWFFPSTGEYQKVRGLHIAMTSSKGQGP